MRARLLRHVAALGLIFAALLAGCDMLGMESGSSVTARKEAEGKAIGSACRQAMRAIEDCYTLNSKAPKAAIFAGWREMDEYMRENKLEGIVPVVPRKSASPASAPAEGEAGAEVSADPAPAARAPARGTGKLKASH